MVSRFLPDGAPPSSKYPSSWGRTPADETLEKAFQAAMTTRPVPDKKLLKDYQSLFGALLHVTKWRPEVSAALGRCGSCLAICTPELYECLVRILVFLSRTPELGPTFNKYAHDADKIVAYADSDWGVKRSTTGYCVFLGGAVVSSASRRQHCITLSSTEAELMALADLAIELLYVVNVCCFMGLEITAPITVHTDNKGAYDLCHRYTSAQHSRHIDRKVFKMRELRGAGAVTVKYIPTDKNPADIFTKIVGPQTFERHLKTIHNVPEVAGKI